ncbi:putative transcription factor C2H2 family [Helianthus annuus]|uniref:RING-type E3 ubiquitin transferase n=1 Tax=Helianthus annuus TaxID=4232 RepID=A0A251VEH2_HELAN|nr:RING-H2 finger protein ATL38 [Helianthus annuus]KAF5818589.1 putative transcription factor C2H2 family [Helianthus annuus]KAJ0604847.1 putative transcription factor C2H2 family [Helianthus annuus]KAJ0618861.1 putative transcription factor C2H2 family [Helianthus annuus]KAJ0777320.1 putative transcription factor C2H2 family [Helianthus annuus]KAJ0940044.1 putative transcription factor C2H2 family [Helianthus annuus]
MDQNKFSLIKRVVVMVLVLLAANSYATTVTTNEPPLSAPLKTELKIHPTMAILFAFLLTAFLSTCLFFFYLCRYTNRQLALAATTGHSGDQRTAMALATAPRGLDPAVIATFTSFTYSTVKDIKIGQHVLECAVCLNEFGDHEVLRLLPECNHVFHRDCIDEWLASHVTCPVCRASLVPNTSQHSQETELTSGQNRHTKDHVSVELVNLKHDLAPPTKLSRSCSMGQVMVQRNVENVDRYTLRLPDKVQNVLINTRTDVSLSSECSLNTSLKSASANFIRGSNYFAYERFGHERRLRSGNGFSNNIVNVSTATSERFLTSVRSSNKDTDMMTRLNDS